MTAPTKEVETRLKELGCKFPLGSPESLAFLEGYRLGYDEATIFAVETIRGRQP